MLKKFKNILGGWMNVIETKSVIASNKATLDSEKLIKMALDVADDISKLRKAKEDTKTAIRDALNKSEQHFKRYISMENNIKQAIKDGIEVGDTQYHIALQSKQLSEAYKTKVEEMEVGIGEYDIAVDKLRSVMQDLKMQKDLLKLNEESAELGLEVKDVESYYNNRLIDVDTLLDKVGIMTDTTLNTTTKLDLEVYKASLK